MFDDLLHERFIFRLCVLFIEDTIFFAPQAHTAKTIVATMYAGIGIIHIVDVTSAIGVKKSVIHIDAA